jgi:hypothetical protein
MDILSCTAHGCREWVAGAGDAAGGEGAWTESVGGEETAAEVAGDEGAVEMERDRGGPLAQTDFGAMLDDGLRWWGTDTLGLVLIPPLGVSRRASLRNNWPLLSGIFGLDVLENTPTTSMTRLNTMWATETMTTERTTETAMRQKGKQLGKHRVTDSVEVVRGSCITFAQHLGITTFRKHQYSAPRRPPTRATAHSPVCRIISAAVATTADPRRHGQLLQ